MTDFFLQKVDAIELLKSIPSGTVDLVVTDPAYESLEKHRKKGTTTRLKQSKGSSNKWFDIFPNTRFPELLIQIWRVLKANSHFYMFCDQETMFVVKPMAEACGFTFWKPLVWDKVNIGMGYHYRCRYELILFFEKGKLQLNDLAIPDVLESKRIYKGYPTEKPVDINQILIQQSTQPGAVVVDPFMGSGSAGVAALQAGCHFLGGDTSQDSLDKANSRLVDAGGNPLDQSPIAMPNALFPCG